MFQPLDKQKRELYIDDIVEYNGMKWEIISFPSESEAQISPQERGEISIVQTSELEVIESTIRDIESLSTIEEFQKLIERAEERHALAREREGKKKAPKEGKKKTEVLDI